MRILIKLASLFALLTPPCFAAGGACPSGANYTNPSNPTGALVTLASLGVGGAPGCYYVAANGSDSNDGLSEASGHPWLHAPQMPNCTSNCATVQNQTNGISPGTGIIFRGGDTWHFGNSAAAPYTGGVWNFNSGQTPNGTAANPLYIGVDVTWFSGASWTRPVLTADNPICNLSTLSGSCFHDTTNTFEVTYVSSCAFQVSGSQNTFIRIDARQYYIIDNFELTGLCSNKVGQISHYDDVIDYGSLAGPVWFLNDYIHGWSHVQFAASNGSAGCTGSNVCVNIYAFDGGRSQSSPPGETIANVVVDGSDSDPVGAGFCFSGLYDVAYSVIIGTSQCVTNAIHLFHDNLYHDFYENGHSNVLESLNEIAGTNAVYNNVFFNLETTGGTGGVGIWPSPPVGTTDYIFNNIFYNVGQMEVFNLGQNGSSQGTLNIFNNLWQINSGSSETIFGCPATTHPATIANNHYIMEGATPYGANCPSGGSLVTNLQMNNATATTDGYTSSQTFVFSPTASNSPTVGTGTNQNSVPCAALMTAAGSDSTLSDAASACGNDTRYACIYVTSNHTVSCPARTALPWPISTAWNIGPYVFTSASVPNGAPCAKCFVSSKR